MGWDGDLEFRCIELGESDVGYRSVWVASFDIAPTVEQARLELAHLDRDSLPRLGDRRTINIAALFQTDEAAAP